MEYKNYTVEDLVTDNDFRDWVLNPHPNNKAVWNNYILSDPTIKQKIQQAKKIVEYSQPKNYKVKEEVIGLGLAQLKEHYQKTTQPHTSPIKQLIPRAIKIAAVALIFLLIGNIKQVTQDPNHLVFSTFSEQQKEIVLPEGSSVIMDKSSQVTFNKNWRETGKRIATLSGKAYFSVKKKNFQGKKIAFVVKTPDLNVEVLGTEFNVDITNQITQVVLNSGSVKLHAHSTNQEIMMEPGDVVEYFHNLKKLVIRSNVNHKPYVS